METEIWFNLLAECRRRSLMVVVANARMSQRSANGYKRLSVLTREAFEGLAVVCAQSESDANRIASLGAHYVSVCGNLKFDMQVDARMVDAGTALRGSMQAQATLTFASTREGEEKLLLAALKAQDRYGIVTMMVPRHPQRFDEVATLLAAEGFTYVRRSSGSPIDNAAVLLGDTMGEMAVYYSASDVVIMGGTLLPYGGQNLIEASAVGVPVVLGPHVHNFSEASRLAIECGAAIQVGNAGEAVSAALALLKDPARRETMRAAGLAFCAVHRGATQRHLAAIRALLEEAPEAKIPAHFNGQSAANA